MKTLPWELVFVVEVGKLCEHITFPEDKGFEFIILLRQWLCK